MSKFKTLFQSLPVFATTVLLVAFTYLYISIFVPPGDGTTPVVVEFEQGASFSQMAKTLKKEGLIRDLRFFTLLARIKGSTKKVQAGEYEFNASMRPLDVLEKLEKGWVIKHPVTIPEGYNIREIADLLEKKGLSRKDRFMARACDKDFVTALGINAPTVEGFLFPETYQFPKGLSEEAMIKNMVSRFREALTDDLKMRAKTFGFSINEVVTLASVVEKETGVAAERPRIARVFLNRLKKGIMLQSDPTVIYGIKDFNGNLTKKHLLTETPYNTYRKRGLPAGPIANPGIESVRAVLYPEDGQYLYFVSKNDGTHYFSRTLSEHNRAVYQYQIAGRRGKKQNLPQRH